MFGGKYLNNWHMAELHAKEAPDRVRELEQWGGVFDRTPDRKMSQRAFGGHTYRRLVHIGDRTGLELIRTLQDKAVHAGIDVFMECTITRLLKDGDRVCGAFGYWRATGEFVVFAAPAVVLATGGAGKCWRITSNSWECTGDGHALAYEAGAELIDMEFVQFHPTGMVWPPGVIGLLVTEAVRGEGGILRNANGERFMERYDPKRLELSTRDVVARAIYTEVKEGRGTPTAASCSTSRTCLPRPSGATAEHVRPVHGARRRRHHARADGGRSHLPLLHGRRPRGRRDRASTVPGLFAAGECSGGMNGANRLGGNSLSDLLVFGRRIGDAAARHSAEAPAPQIEDAQTADAAAEMTRYLSGPGDEDPYRLHAELQATMHEDVGIFRDEAGLTAALARLDELERRAADARSPSSTTVFNPGWHLCRDVRNMLIVSQAVARAAFLRHESRGAHSRLDYPAYDDYWGEHNIVVRKDAEGMRVEPRPVVKTAELAALIEERKKTERA